MSTVAVIGLGNMGLPMATSLQRAGHRTIGVDISEERRGAAEKAGLRAVSDVKTAVDEADAVVLSLPTGRHVVEAVEQSGLLDGRRSKRVIVVDTSTSDPETSRSLADRLDAVGCGFLDAPVSGGTVGAANGTLAMMIGGRESDFALARPVIDALASKVHHVGPNGAGNVAKLVNNLLVAAHMLTTSEALKLAVAAGVPAQAVLPVINAATGKSAVSEMHFPKWVMTEAFSSGFTMGLMRKDVRLALELAGEVGIDLPVSQRVAALWKESEQDYADSVDFTRLAAVQL